MRTTFTLTNVTAFESEIERGAYYWTGFGGDSEEVPVFMGSVNTSDGRTFDFTNYLSEEDEEKWEAAAEDLSSGKLPKSVTLRTIPNETELYEFIDYEA